LAGFFEDDHSNEGGATEMELPLPEHVGQQLEHMRTNAFETTKGKQRNKFDRLVKNHHDHKDRNIGGMTTVDKKRWVINKSQRTLTPAETSLLEKGLNYAITPKKPLLKDVIITSEEACHSMQDPTQKELLRAEVVRCLKHSKPIKSNITGAEYKALMSLSKDNKIVILPADKGRATVLLDKTEYQTKMQTLLADEDTYMKLKKDPTMKYKRELVNTLLKWQKTTDPIPQPLY
jgi:hypothetical protein